MKLISAENIQHDRPSSEEIYAEIEVGDSIRILFDPMILQLLLVESKDEASQTVTGIIDEDMPLDERIVLNEELITVEMHQVFGVMSNDPTFDAILDELGLSEDSP